jgi:hypothetical protein
MKRVLLISGGIFIVLAILYYTPVPAPSTSSTPSTRARNPSSSAIESAAPTQRSTPPERSTLADALNAPASNIQADLRLVSSLLDTFRSNFLQTGNPVGNNADITAALTGRNRLRLSLVPPDHPAINQHGELCDRWGTPFFFHAESATRMEIRSAGPDRKMWNDDDVIFAP